MKIALYHNLPPGGAKRVVYEQVKALSNKHKVILFELSSTNEEFLDIRQYCEGVEIFNFDRKSNLPSFISRIHRDYKELVELKRIHRIIAKKINSSGAQVCFVHTDMFTEAPFLLRYLTIPSLYYDQEMLAIVYSDFLKFREKVPFYKKMYEKMNRMIRKRVDYLSSTTASKTLTNSKFMKDHIKEVYAKNAEVIYPGVDVKVFNKNDRTEDIICFAGRKRFVEGYDLFKKAMSGIENKHGFKVSILGEVNEKADDKKMATWYSRAYLTVCANKIEAFGLKSIEITRGL
jgi:glycosyltransferase involved in cell wall biosynthesis